MHYPSACPSWAKEATTPELRPHRTVGTRLKSPMVILARLMGCAAYCLELGSTKGDVQSFFKHCFGNMVETARDIVAWEGMKLPAAGLEQNFDCLRDCDQLWLTGFINLICKPVSLLSCAAVIAITGLNQGSAQSRNASLGTNCPQGYVSGPQAMMGHVGNTDRYWAAPVCHISSGECVCS